MTLRLGRIERYVLGHTLVGIGAAAALLSAVVVLIDFVDLSRTLGGRANPDEGVAQHIAFDPPEPKPHAPAPA